MFENITHPADKLPGNMDDGQALGHPLAVQFERL